MPDIDELEAVEFMSEPYDSRHKPVKVLCRSKSGTEACMVKICRTRVSAAASISEWLGTLALRHSPVNSLEPVKVKISDNLFDVAASQVPAEIPNVGVHYGTRWRQNVDPGPIDIDEKIDWVQPFYLYGFDVWLMVFDRRVSGNVLLELFQGTNRKLIAADQSDCFGGATVMLEGVEAVRNCKSKAELAVVDSGGAPADFNQTLARHGLSWEKISTEVIGYCKKAATRAEAASRNCPSAWADIAGIDPAAYSGYLSERSEKLVGLLKPQLFNPPNKALEGGILLPGWSENK